MDPRLQAGVELQLEKQAQQEHDSSLSGVLSQHFKQAEETAEPIPTPPAEPADWDNVDQTGRSRSTLPYDLSGYNKSVGSKLSGLLRGIKRGGERANTRVEKWLDDRGHLMEERYPGQGWLDRLENRYTPEFPPEKGPSWLDRLENRYTTEFPPEKGPSWVDKLENRYIGWQNRNTPPGERP